MVETPLDCTVLVTTKLKRTCKLLSAIGRGCVIVSPNWLTMSKAAGNFVGKKFSLPWCVFISGTCHVLVVIFVYMYEPVCNDLSVIPMVVCVSVYVYNTVVLYCCEMWTLMRDLER